VVLTSLPGRNGTKQPEVGDHWVIYGEVMESVVTDETTPPLVWLDRGFVKIEA